MRNRRSVLLSAAALAGTAVAGRWAHANEGDPGGRALAHDRARCPVWRDPTEHACAGRRRGERHRRHPFARRRETPAIFGDTRGEADIGVTETERLITRERVHALIGAFQSGVGLPSSAVAERYEVPWLNFGTVDRITQRGFRYIFRPHANDTLKARAWSRASSASAQRMAG